MNNDSNNTSPKWPLAPGAKNRDNDGYREIDIESAKGDVHIVSVGTQFYELSNPATQRDYEVSRVSPKST